MVGLVQTITADEILLMNRRLIEEHGGLGVGLMNPGTLEYALEEIQGSLFGAPRCPTLHDKAAALGWRIIRGHVFVDGNKRTGMMAAMALLRLNGIALEASLQEYVNVALAIACGQATRDDFADFLRAHSR